MEQPIYVTFLEHTKPTFLPGKRNYIVFYIQCTGPALNTVLV